jgi:MFS family permease
MVCALVAGATTTWGLVVPVLPVYADRLGADPAALGVIVAAFGLGRVVVGIPAGALANRVDRRRLLLAAAALLAAVTLVTALVTSLEQLIAVRLVTGLAGGVVMTMGQALLTSGDPGRLGRTMAALQSYHILGGALGPAIGGLVVGIDDRLPFVVGGFGLTGLVLLAVWRIPAGFGQAARVAPQAPPAPAGLWTRGLVGICIVTFIIFFVRFGGQQFLIPVLAYTRAGLSPAQLGAALGAVTVAGLLLVRFAGMLTDRWGRRPMVASATTMLGLACLGFLGARHPVLFLAALVLTGLLITAGSPATVAYLADCTAPERRGLAIGISRTFGDTATLLGPPVLGWLVGEGRGDAAIMLLGTSAIISGLLFTYLSRGQGRPSVSRDPLEPSPSDRPRTSSRKEASHA